MPSLSIPFGKRMIPLRLAEEARLIVARARPVKTLTQSDFRSAIDHPIESETLSRIVEPRSSVAIVVDDYTRPTPTPAILPIVLSELKRNQVSEDDITVFVGGGLHTPALRHEFPAIVGEEIARTVKMTAHNCDDDSSLIELGSSSRGTPIRINRHVVEADFRICIGLIEPHQKAGFSGGAKSIIPGVAGRETINRNHSMKLPIREGVGRIEGNPVRADMEEIAQKVGVDFIINAVLNERKEAIGLFAGDLIAAHRAGVDLARNAMEVRIDEEADIVVVSPGGHPRDVDLWQTEGKALTRVWGAANKGSEIVVIAECPRGIGNARLEDWLVGSSAKDIEARFEREGYTLVGEKAHRLAQLSKYAQLTFHTSGLDPGKLSKLPISFTDDPQSKLEQALGNSEDSSVLVIPNAPSVLIETLH